MIYHVPNSSTALACLIAVKKCVGQCIFVIMLFILADEINAHTKISAVVYAENLFFSETYVRVKCENLLVLPRSLRARPISKENLPTQQTPLLLSILAGAPPYLKGDVISCSSGGSSFDSLLDAGASNNFVDEKLEILWVETPWWHFNCMNGFWKKLKRSRSRKNFG